LTAAAVVAPSLGAQARHENTIIDLWAAGRVAFGVFVPNEAGFPQPGSPPGSGAGPAPGERPRPIYTREGGEHLAMNPLYDFVFLNLEGSYDAAAVTVIAEGLRSPKAVGRKALIVRIPPINRDGSVAARIRVREAFEAGADGVTIPHVETVEEARLAIGFFRDARVDVWSRANPNGEKLAMLMIEDPGALAEAKAFADVDGYSILACGIGSLTQALNGDRAAAEAGNQRILAETKRVKLVNMLTASPQDVEQRVHEGFLALLGQGPSADEMIRIGRKASGR
jgi:2-keto-3-deoxy-L-rhamnonate aldolase RhmA